MFDNACAFVPKVQYFNPQNFLSQHFYTWSLDVYWCRFSITNFRVVKCKYRVTPSDLSEKIKSMLMIFSVTVRYASKPLQYSFNNQFTIPHCHLAKARMIKQIACVWTHICFFFENILSISLNTIFKKDLFLTCHTSIVSVISVTCKERYQTFFVKIQHQNKQFFSCFVFDFLNVQW